MCLVLHHPLTEKMDDSGGQQVDIQVSYSTVISGEYDIQPSSTPMHWIGHMLDQVELPNNEKN